MLEETPEVSATPPEETEPATPEPQPEGKACPSCGAFYVSEDVAHVHTVEPIIDAATPDIQDVGEESTPEPEPEPAKRADFSTIFFGKDE